MSRRGTKSKALAAPPWWINPGNIAAAIVLPLLLAALLVSPEFHEYFGRPQKFLTPEYFIIGAAGVLFFWVGAFLGSRLTIAGTQPPPRVEPALHEQSGHLTTASRVIFVVTLLSYLILLWPVIDNPAVLFNIFAGDPSAQYISQNFKEGARIPGITSLTQLGIVYVVLFFIRSLYAAPSSIPLVERAAFALLIGLALVRSIAYSERLAIIELILPALILVCRRAKLPRLLLALAPVLALMVLFLLFSGLEYFRSWQAYYQYVEGSFLQFSAYRLFGYYLNAIDTGAGFLNYMGGGHGPVVTLQWLWSFPIDFGQAALLREFGFERSDYLTFLNYYASPEFNNDSALFGPFFDYGVVGGALFWLLLGGISGQLFRGYVLGSLSGLIIYPSWYIGILEIPRAFAFSGARYFAPLVVSLLLILWLSETSRLTGKARKRRSFVVSRGGS